MEDTKSFRVRQLQYDCSNIGTTLKMLEFLKPGYAEICEAADDLLKQLKVLLVEDGIAGYLPKEVIAVVPTAEELAKDLEAKRLAEEVAAKIKKGTEEAFAKAELIAKEAEEKADKIAKLKETIKELEV